jgi:hypothetical protein
MLPAPVVISSSQQSIARNLSVIPVEQDGSETTGKDPLTLQPPEAESSMHQAQPEAPRRQRSRSGRRQP